MNILHISDLHFGPGHWSGNNERLLEKLNSYSADLVINTGDSTHDSLEHEFKATYEFLDALRCPLRISLIGNHDKRSPEATALFRQYLGEEDIVMPLIPANCQKDNIYLKPTKPGTKEEFTDINFVKKLTVGEETLLLVGLDSTELSQDNGKVDQEMLRTVAQCCGAKL